MFSLGLALGVVHALLPFSLLELLHVDKRESTLKDILCLRNVGAPAVLLLVQDSAIVGEGEDVDGVQLLVLMSQKGLNYFIHFKTSDVTDFTHITCIKITL